MKLGEFIFSQLDNMIVSVGVSSGFCFIGNKETFKADAKKIDAKFKSNADRKLKKVDRDLTQLRYKSTVKRDEVSYEVDANGVERAVIKPWKKVLKELKEQIKEQEALYAEVENYIIDYVPIADREIKETYNKFEVEKDGIVALVEGTENGRYWLKSEYDKGVVPAEDEAETETEGEEDGNKKGLTMTNKEYREHDGISKSQLSEIAKSPLHFKYAMENQKEDTKALLFGRAVHKYILEKDDFEKEFAVAPVCDRRTKEGKEIYKEFELSSVGKDVIDAEMFEQIKEMAEVATANKYVNLLLNGEHETSYFWVDKETREMCKCRPDCLTEIGDQKIIVDYKTTDNAETEAFKKSAISYFYDLQAGMYTEGMKACTGNDYVFMFIAQEKKPPYAINIMQADEYMIKEGTQLFHDLLGTYHECKVTDHWYGYEGKDNEIGNLGLPAWLQKQFE